MITITNIPENIYVKMIRHFPVNSINKVDVRCYEYNNQFHNMYDIKMGNDFWIETWMNGTALIFRIGCYPFILYPDEFHHISFL